jgi:hypothetical protein
LTRTVVVEAANAAAFGSAWVVQFVLCDRVLFRSRRNPGYLGGDDGAGGAGAGGGATGNDGAGSTGGGTGNDGAGIDAAAVRAGR